MITLYPVPLTGSDYTYEFSDEPDYDAAAKQIIIAAWRQFISHGFSQPNLTLPLFHYLRHECGLNPYHPAEFWEHWFNSYTSRLSAFICQFGTHKRHAIDQDHNWLGGTTTDLKHAMIAEMAPIAPALLTLFSEIEQQHTHLLQTWQERFAPTTCYQTLPTNLHVTRNIRSLLAYVAQIAQTKELPGLQQVMFFGGNYG